MKYTQHADQNYGDSTDSSWVLRKQIDLVYQDMPFAVISTTVIVAVVFLLLSDSVAWQSLATWFSLFCIVLAFRAVTGWVYSKQKKKYQVDYAQAETLYTIGLLLTGALWGGAGLILFPVVDLTGKILIFIVIMGVAAASSTAMAYRRAPVYISTALMILPLVFGIVISDLPNTLSVSIAMLAYMALLLRAATTFHSNNERMLWLQEDAMNNSQKLLVQREKAELANQAKSEFLSLMSHELRTPLNTVLGLNELQLLDRNEPLTTKQRKRAIKINDAGHHLLSLVNDVLDFSRIESGEIDINISAIDCQTVLRDALKLVEGKAKSRGISVDFDETERYSWVEADYIRLKQVLVNLLDNAVKYNREGGAIKVAFRDGGDDCLRIAIEDTGYGIADELKGELFKPFSRLNAEHLGIEGTGIGLSFSKQLMELMNGKIGVESIQNQGSCFWIELRRASKPALQQGKEAPFRPVVYKEPGTATEQGKKLLLAEDNLVNQEVAVDMLEQSGFEVVVAKNGADALAALNRDRYSLVLMDCEMPVMDGFTATEKLRSRESEMQLSPTPVIALTAHAVQGMREKCIASGMNDFLAKPFSFEELTAKVAEWTRPETDKPADGHPVECSHQRSNQALASNEAQESCQPGLSVSQGDVLNHQALSQLRSKQQYRKRNLVRRVVSIYLEETPVLLQQLVDARAELDTNTLSHIAHKLKSSSLTVGANAIADACKQIEELATQGRTEDSIIDSMSEQYAAVKEELLKVLSSE